MLNHQGTVRQGGAPRGAPWGRPSASSRSAPTGQETPADRDPHRGGVSPRPPREGAEKVAARPDPAGSSARLVGPVEFDRDAIPEALRFRKQLHRTAAPGA